MTKERFTPAHFRTESATDVVIDHSLTQVNEIRRLMKLNLYPDEYDSNDVLVRVEILLAMHDRGILIGLNEALLDEVRTWKAFFLKMFDDYASVNEMTESEWYLEKRSSIDSSFSELIDVVESGC